MQNSKTTLEVVKANAELGYRISVHFNDGTVHLFDAWPTILKYEDKLSALKNSQVFKDSIKIIDGKVVLKLSNDNINDCFVLNTDTLYNSKTIFTLEGLNMCETMNYIKTTIHEKYNQNNKMSEVANLLGVKLYEEFYDKVLSYIRYRFTEYNFEVKVGNNDWKSYDWLLCSFLNGSHEFTKVNGKFNIGDSYYVPNICVGTGMKKYNKYEWQNSKLDNIRLNNELVCKTEKEAIELGDWIINKIKKHRKE